MQDLNRLIDWIAQRRAAAKAARAARQQRGWLRDPLSHPALAGMSSHQLADLPLDRSLFRTDAAPQPNVVPLARARTVPPAQIRRSPSTRAAAMRC